MQIETRKSEKFLEGLGVWLYCYPSDKENKITERNWTLTLDFWRWTLIVRLNWRF